MWKTYKGFHLQSENTTRSLTTNKRIVRICLEDLICNHENIAGRAWPLRSRRESSKVGVSRKPESKKQMPRLQGNSMAHTHLP